MQENLLDPPNGDCVSTQWAWPWAETEYKLQTRKEPVRVLAVLLLGESLPPGQGKGICCQHAGEGPGKKQVPPTGDVKIEVNFDLEVGCFCGQERRREISYIWHSQKKQQKRNPAETEVGLPSEFKEISIALCSGKLRLVSVLSSTSLQLHGAWTHCLFRLFLRGSAWRLISPGILGSEWKNTGLGIWMDVCPCHQHGWVIHKKICRTSLA